MITIISGTNRKDSATLKVANQYASLLERQGEAVQVLSLERLTGSFLSSEMFNDEGREKSFSDLQEKFIINAEKFIILAPEYNGSFPGVLKLFIDACSTYKSDESFTGKKVALVGIASGRAGNLRGLDHLSCIMNHLKVVVFPNKLPISSIHLLMEEGKIKDEGTIETITKQIKEFVEF